MGIQGALEIPSQLSRIDGVGKEVLSIITAQGYDTNSLFFIRLALDEALINAVKHGNCNDPKKSITVEYEIDPQIIRLTVTDMGQGFDHTALDDPTDPENLDRSHGWGVLLIREYMDEVHYNSRGNQLTMVYRRGSPQHRRPKLLDDD